MFVPRQNRSEHNDEVAVPSVISIAKVHSPPATRRKLFPSLAVNPSRRQVADVSFPRNKAHSKDNSSSPSDHCVFTSHCFDTLGGKLGGDKGSQPGERVPGNIGAVKAPVISPELPLIGKTRNLPIPKPRASSSDGYSLACPYSQFPGNESISNLTRMYDSATWTMYKRIVSARAARMTFLLDSQQSQCHQAQPATQQGPPSCQKSENLAQVVNKVRTQKHCERPEVCDSDVSDDTSAMSHASDIADQLQLQNQQKKDPCQDLLLPSPFQPHQHQQARQSPLLYEPFPALPSSVAPQNSHNQGQGFIPSCCQQEISKSEDSLIFQLDL